MIGLFINTLPLRVPIQNDRPVLDWLREIRSRYVAQRPFEHSPLLDVQAAAEVQKGTPLFDSIIVYNDTLMDSAMRKQGGAWARRGFAWIEQTNFPLTLFGYGEPALLLKLSYDLNHVSHARAEAMIGYAEARSCRAVWIARYFGMSGVARCGNCDACDGSLHATKERAVPPPIAIVADPAALVRECILDL